MVSALSPRPQVVMPVGGRGTRLRPLTDGIPKCLVPIGARPFLELVLERLSVEGIERVVLCTGWLGEVVERVIGAGDRFGLQITYSRESRPLGAIGAARNALDLLDEAFVLMYGDTYLTLPIDRFVTAAAQLPMPAAMAVVRAEITDNTGNVSVAGDSVTAYSKTGGSDWIDYGMLAIERELLVGDGAAHEDELFAELALTGKLGAFRWWRPFHEIGSPSAYAAFVHLVESGELE